jgi:hypothetical protein
MGILPVMSIFIFIFVSLGQALACQLCEKFSTDCIGKESQKRPQSL